jgi:hypothetical protein
LIRLPLPFFKLKKENEGVAIVIKTTKCGCGALKRKVRKTPTYFIVLGIGILDNMEEGRGMPELAGAAGGSTTDGFSMMTVELSSSDDAFAAGTTALTGKAAPLARGATN